MRRYIDRCAVVVLAVLRPHVSEEWESLSAANFRRSWRFPVGMSSCPDCRFSLVGAILASRRSRRSCGISLYSYSLIGISNNVAEMQQTTRAQLALDNSSGQLTACPWRRVRRRSRSRRWSSCTAPSALTLPCAVRDALWRRRAAPQGLRAD